MKKNEYKCDMCGKIYKKGWSEEKALKERDELWNNPNEDWAIVCDDCFNKIHPEKNLELARKSGYKK